MKWSWPGLGTNSTPQRPPPLWPRSSLNLAIGPDVSAPPTVIDVTEAAPFRPFARRLLADGREPGAASYGWPAPGVEAAQEEGSGRRADFAPRVVAEGDLFDFQQANPRPRRHRPRRVPAGVGPVRGRQTRRRTANNDAEVRSNAAEAGSVADLIAFQVNEAYRVTVAARKGIDLARPGRGPGRGSRTCIWSEPFPQEGEAIPRILSRRGDRGSSAPRKAITTPFTII